MKLKAKIKYILDSKNYTLSDYAKRTMRSRQAVSKRVSDGALDLKEVIDICEMTGYTLAIVDNKGDVVISFSKDDLVEK